jgi:hypothetical protein
MEPLTRVSLRHAVKMLVREVTEVHDYVPETRAAEVTQGGRAFGRTPRGAGSSPALHPMSS